MNTSTHTGFAVGNIHAGCTDAKSPTAPAGDGTTLGYAPNIVSMHDYYPFGMVMPGRTVEGAGYRYGFQAQEKDDEVSGAGNSYTAEFWQYDPRLGRRLNQDPRPNPSFSNYSVLAGNPISFTDILGDTIKNTIQDVVGTKRRLRDDANTVYNALLAEHQGSLKNRHIRRYRRESGLRDAERVLTYWQGVDDQINSMLTTFQVVMPSEFEYLNTLPVNILIDFKSITSPRGDNNPQSTFIPLEIWVIEPAGSGIGEDVWTGNFNGDIVITLYGGGVTPFKTNLLANEFGDIDYVFNYLKANDPISLQRWRNTASSKGKGYFTDTEGAGRYSFDYQDRFETKFNIVRKNYPSDMVDRLNWIIHR